MSYTVTLHPAQVSILRELLFHRSATFATLQHPTGLSSDHFSFHIARLLKHAFVTKNEDGSYTLSPAGKEYANTIDTDNRTIERQPKVAVLLAATKIVDGREQFLFQQRKKHPYYDFWGFVTGKIRWGESITETAVRELREETGLIGTPIYHGIYHEHAYQEESGELLEDKIFFIMKMIDCTGELIADFEGGHNEWLFPEELDGQKVYRSFKTELSIAMEPRSLCEEVYSYPKQDF
jgi:8-oxo-dGTP pyrophosphatase MutT (NUDIX family)